MEVQNNPHKKIIIGMPAEMAEVRICKRMKILVNTLKDYKEA